MLKDDPAAPARGRAARVPALRELWTRLRAGTIGAASIAPTAGVQWIPGAMGIALDVVVTAALLASGWTLGGSNIAGLLAGALVALALRGLEGARAPGAQAPQWPSAAQVGRRIVVAVLALGFRGGAIATALAYGLPGWPAIALGLALGWGALAAGEAFYARAPAEPRPPAALRWTVAAAGIAGSIFLLHALYLKVFPLTPEEGYYWNYSIRPDFGYLDHPPMVAWLIVLAETFFGHGEASIRIVSLACGLAVIGLVYRLAERLVDRPAALLAAALAAAIPYSFFAAGLMTTPDAPLAAAWAAALYFFHRALIGNEGRAWYGAGASIGLGLLSKYTIVTLGAAALAFCILDRRARAWLLRPAPYVAVLIALALFAPVVYWNAVNEWASFRFQAGGRFGDDTSFSLHHMLKNAVVVATPLPIAVLPLLFVARWTAHPGQFPEPAHAHARNRLFVSCFIFVPLAVFAWSALRHLPRLNWTGPIWLASLPLLAWAIVRADALTRFGLGPLLRRTAGGVIGALLVFYAALSYYVVLGIPGVPYPASFARAIGWPAAARQLQTVRDRLARESGASPVIVGMDKYFIASQLAFFGTPEYLAADHARGATGAGAMPLPVTAIAPLSGEALMFARWDPPETLRGRTLIMVARRREDLATERLAPHFRELDAAIHALPLSSSGYGGDRRRIAEYFYRIGYDYRPRPGSR